MLAVWALMDTTCMNSPVSVEIFPVALKLSMMTSLPVTLIRNVPDESPDFCLKTVLNPSVLIRLSAGITICETRYVPGGNNNLVDRRYGIGERCRIVNGAVSGCTVVRDLR